MQRKTFFTIRQSDTWHAICLSWRGHWHFLMISPRPFSSRYFTFYWTSVTLHKQLQPAWQEQVQGFLLRSHTCVYNSTLPPSEWKRSQGSRVLSPSDASVLCVNRPTDHERSTQSLPALKTYSTLVSAALFVLILELGSAGDSGGQATLETQASNFHKRRTCAARPPAQVCSLAEGQQMSFVGGLKDTVHIHFVLFFFF